MAVQAVLDISELPIGTAVVVFFQSLSGAIFVSVGNNVLQNTLIHGIGSIPDISDEQKVTLLHAGLTQVRVLVPSEIGRCRRPF